MCRPKNQAMYYIVINGVPYMFTTIEQAKKEIPKISLASIRYDENIMLPEKEKE